jgi:hypothetical protein
MSHTSIKNEPLEDRCNCEQTDSIPILDTSLSIENGRVEVDLYKKETERTQYLLPSSCHPKTTSKAIPFSLSLRIVRICSKQENRNRRLNELKELLLARNYPESLIDRSIAKAIKIPRKIALLKVKQKIKQKRPIFALQYDPRLPALQPIIAKHWRSMKIKDKYLKECFPEPPLTAFRRQPNLRNLLIKSKVPAPIDRYPKRKLKGMTSCGKQCPACPYILEGNKVKIDEKSTWNIEKKFSCESFNIIYLLNCNKCKQKYIGTTGRQLKSRIAEHKGYIAQQVSSRATGHHWNLPGHSLADLKVTILEQSKSKEEDYRKEREKFFIRKFDTYNKGINREW